MNLKSLQQSIWKEKNLEKGEDFYKKVEYFSQKFSMPDYFSKLLLDNKIDNEDKFINFINSSSYFLHPSFLFKDILKALELINKAKRLDIPILILGDSDVDGIVGIKILYTALQKYGIKNIFYSLPESDEPYGISINKIDIAYSKGARLIITVDNGISSVKEIEYAKSKGMDVIITDHHNPQKKLPLADAIINPRLENYSYCNCLSGSGVAWKLIEALTFSQTKIFEQLIFFIDIEITSFKTKENKNTFFYNLSLLEIYNLQIKNYCLISYKLDDENILEKFNNININKSLTFSLGKIVTKEEISKFLNEILTKQLNDNAIVVINNKELFDSLINSLSINLPNPNIKTIESLVNNNEKFLLLLETYKYFYIQKKDFLFFKLFATIRYNYQKCIDEMEIYLPYLALATIADIMPLQNENRYIVSKGLELINSIKPDFIVKILSVLINVSFPLNSYDIIWKISPLLNSPGRFGRGEILLNFFLSNKDDQSLISLKEINDFNIKRTMIVENIFQTIKLTNLDKPIIFIEKEGVEPGLTGLLCAKYVSLTSKPVIFVTKVKNGIFGSMRSKNSFNSFLFLSKFSDYFENFGGHPFASGFTIIKEKYDEFYKTINSYIANYTFENEENNYLEYTCEVTFDDLVTNEFEKWYKILQPFGEEFKVPLFFTRNVTLSNPVFIGRNNLSIKLKVSQDDISLEALFFKNKQFLNDIKLNSINSLVYEPYFMQNNKLTLLILDVFKT